MLTTARGAQGRCRPTVMLIESLVCGLLSVSYVNHDRVFDAGGWCIPCRCTSARSHRRTRSRQPSHVAQQIPSGTMCSILHTCFSPHAGVAAFAACANTARPPGPFHTLDGQRRQPCHTQHPGLGFCRLDALAPRLRRYSRLHGRTADTSRCCPTRIRRTRQPRSLRSGSTPWFSQSTARS